MKTKTKIRIGSVTVLLAHRGLALGYNLEINSNARNSNLEFPVQKV